MNWKFFLMTSATMLTGFSKDSLDFLMLLRGDLELLGHVFPEDGTGAFGLELDFVEPLELGLVEHPGKLASDPAGAAAWPAASSSSPAAERRCRPPVPGTGRLLLLCGVDLTLTAEGLTSVDRGLIAAATHWRTGQRCRPTGAARDRPAAIAVASGPGPALPGRPGSWPRRVAGGAAAARRVTPGVLSRRRAS